MSPEGYLRLALNYHSIATLQKAFTRRKLLTCLSLNSLSVEIQGKGVGRSLDGGNLRRFHLLEPQSTRTFCSSVGGETVLSELNSAETSTIDSDLAHHFPYSVNCKLLFDLNLPEGRCVGLQLRDVENQSPNALSAQALSSLDHWIYSVLHPCEIAYAIKKRPSDNARVSFLLGRMALRYALSLLGLRDVLATPNSVCILKDEYGRPNMPPGYLGSISHKKNAAIAMVTLDSSRESIRGHLLKETIASPTIGIGADLEEAIFNRNNIARKVLTIEEIEALGNVEDLTLDEEILVRFSLKESLYKAMHPLICQFVGFQEVQVQPLQNGTAVVDFDLKSGAENHFKSVTAHWRREGEYFLSSASVTLK